MDRRRFVTWLGAGVISPLASHQATPATTADTPGRPDPVDLGGGIVLIDYRLHPGEQPHVVAEIRNDTNRMIDAPVVSLTYPRERESDGFTWASPIIPVIGAGRSVPVFGALPDDAAPGAILASAIFALCSPAEPGEYTRHQQALQDDLVVTVVSERIEDDLYHVQGTIANAGLDVMRDIALRGIVRDSDGRIAGSTASPFWSGLAAGASRDFSMWAGKAVRNKANPFPLLTGTNYTVEIIAGTRGPVSSPGCSFGLPWE
jgi:hypothetical protein